MKIFNDDYCDFCKGLPIGSKDCVYCNGTGKWNAAAQAYLKNHICQCVFSDREFCPICHQKCHHDSSLSPKQKIDPGHGGQSSGIKNNIPEEEFIVV